MNKNDGGPAFPAEFSNEHFEFSNQQFKGMSLRDYFAAKALQGLCANSNAKKDIIYAQMAYAIADDMMKVRES